MIRLLLRITLVGAAIGWVLDTILASHSGGRPPRPIRVTIAVHAPIEHVWRVLTDIPGQPRWMHDMKAVRVLTPPPLGVGTKAEGDIRIFGVQVRDPITVTAFDPPQRFAVRHEGMFSGDGIVELEAGADGGPTVARWEETLVPPYLPHLGALVLAPILRRVFQDDLASLRQLIESGASEA